MNEDEHRAKIIEETLLRIESEEALERLVLEIAESKKNAVVFKEITYRITNESETKDK